MQVQKSPEPTNYGKVLWKNVKKWKFAKLSPEKEAQNPGPKQRQCQNIAEEQQI